MTANYALKCSKCAHEAENDEISNTCPKCGELLEYVFDEEYLKNVQFKEPISFWRYSSVLPEVKRKISLGEGGTPVVEANNLKKTIGLSHLKIKDETRNPTNSYKDRAAALLVSDALSKKSEAIICASVGNIGASLAAYSAKENIACHLIVPRNVDMAKLAQMIVYNAEIYEFGTTLEEPINNIISLSPEVGWYKANQELNPLSAEALKTLFYEITEQTTIPDWIAVSMGSGATIYAIWKGLKELQIADKIDQAPRLIGVQANGCAPIYKAYVKGDEWPVEVPAGDTRATDINIIHPKFGHKALKALYESKGVATVVSDENMYDWSLKIAKNEGIFVELASAASIAGISKLIEEGVIDSSDEVLSIITSSGLKSSDIIKSMSQRNKTKAAGFRMTTKNYIFSVIAEEDSYGYDIWNKIGRCVTIGAIYQHLSELEKKVLIVSYKKGRKKFYTLTDEGKRKIEIQKRLYKLPTPQF